MQAQAGRLDCSIVRSAIDVASALRRLRVLGDVSCFLKDRESVRSYVEEAIDRDLPEDRLRYEELTYKLLGLVPREFDYRKGVVALYTREIGGYYDPIKRVYSMASWLPENLQMPVAVHELTHALQDQHFDLRKMMDEKSSTGDTLLARSALIEGDATIVMLDYDRTKSGKRTVAEEYSVADIMMEHLAESMLSEAVGDAPPALHRLLIFPYVSGLRFVHYLLQHGGYQSVNRAFIRPPTSTREILHPQFYLDKAPPLPPVEPAPIKGTINVSKPTYTDQLGEFVVSVLLSNWVSPLRASNASAGWTGDTVAIYDIPKRDVQALTWKSSWTDERNAREFSHALAEAYSQRFKKEPMPGKNTAFFGGTEVGDVQIARENTEVVVTVLP